VLFEVGLNEACVLLQLVLGDAHGQQLIEDLLHSRIGHVEVVRRRRAGGCGLDGHLARRYDGLGWRLGRLRVAVSRQQITQAKARFARSGNSIHRGSIAWRNDAGRVTMSLSDGTAKGLVSRILVCILLALVHLLLELLCFLFVGKGQTGQTLFELKGVEKGAVLVVLERVVNLLVPDDTAVGRLPQTSQ
jgi:hypothetical protein